VADAPQEMIMLGHRIASTAADGSDSTGRPLNGIDQLAMARLARAPRPRRDRATVARPSHPHEPERHPFAPLPPATR